MLIQSSLVLSAVQKSVVHFSWGHDWSVAMEDVVTFQVLVEHRCHRTALQ